MTHSYVTDSFTCHELRYMSQITLPYTISQTGRLACDMIPSYVTDSSCLVTNPLWLFHMSRTPLDFLTYTLMSSPAICLTHTSQTVTRPYVTNSSWHITFPHTFSWARLRHVSFQRHGLFMAHSYVTNSPWPIHMSQILLTYLYVTHSVEIGSSTTWLTHTSRTPHDSSICHGLLLTYLLTSSYVANFLWLLRIQSHEPTCDSSCLVTNFLWLFHMLRTLLDFFTYNLMSPPATCLIQTSRTPRDSPICHELLLSYLLTFSLQISWARIRHVSFRRHGVLVIRPYITNSPWPIHMSRALVNSLTRQKLCLNRLV